MKLPEKDSPETNHAFKDEQELSVFTALNEYIQKAPALKNNFKPYKPVGLATISSWINTSRHNPGRREKIKLIFFSQFFVAPQKVL